ncbi:hypothetical protein [Flavobacterium sp. 9AF]|uniref:hypothetical protein n=1 Tax=Flavobacterium sp. 9AF TaxID=2653142 RepID=UPI0013591438|nr:hypothetical protein [Flavobacterium sp. 9AF]
MNSNIYMNANVKIKLLIILLIFTSLFGYLEWGNNQHVFIYKSELDIFKKLIQNPKQVAHPFILLPLLGQLLLFFSLFQKKLHKKMLYLGIGCISLLFIFLFLIGLLSMKLKIILGALPFLIISFITIRLIKKQ